MNGASDPKPEPTVMTCGNCCNAVKNTRTVGHVLCAALPPAVVARPGGMGANVYPEMQADRLGCRVFWNVNAQLFILIGQAITLAASGEAGHGQQQSSETDGGA